MESIFSFKASGSGFLAFRIRHRCKAHRIPPRQRLRAGTFLSCRLSSLLLYRAAGSCQAIGKARLGEHGLLDEIGLCLGHYRFRKLSFRENRDTQRLQIRGRNHRGIQAFHCTRLPDRDSRDKKTGVSVLPKGSSYPGKNIRATVLMRYSAAVFCIA